MFYLIYSQLCTKRSGLLVVVMVMVLAELGGVAGFRSDVREYDPSHQEDQFTRNFLLRLLGEGRMSKRRNELEKVGNSHLTTQYHNLCLIACLLCVEPRVTSRFFLNWPPNLNA